MLLLPWGWFRMEKGIQRLEQLKECLAVGSGLEPPASILLLRAWLGIRVCVPRQVCDTCVLALCGCRYKSLHICVGAWVVPTYGWRWAWLWSSGEMESRSGFQRRWSRSLFG